MSDPDDEVPEMAEAFAGQSGGLCGAAVPGALWLITGLHTGHVGFVVEVHDEEPPLDTEWEDVVEVSFRPVSERTSLVEWSGEDVGDLDLAQTDYRVRYCAQRMDEGGQLDTRMAEEPEVDRYLLQFWPAPPRADLVVRQTAQDAAYWHAYARDLPPPPTPEERAAAELLARQEEEREAEERRLDHERAEWGGRLPSDALRAVSENAHGLLRFDSDLVHALDDAGAEVQRAVASLAARRACEAAGLTGLPWITRALAAVTERRPLPPPFDDPDRMWETLSSDPQVPDRTVRPAVPPPWLPDRPEMSPAVVWTRSDGGPCRPGRIAQPYFALSAVVAAADPDPLTAALEAVWHAVATYGEHYPELLRGIWAACADRGEQEADETSPGGGRRPSGSVGRR
ncbi:hypothetical protein [Streptomyces sp. NPDC089919]|uniref:hypothetical protein n=1 Tax=Streptomyces sp. NPDC089919 TaxID=3155188 RepID=UPI00341CEC1C